MENLFLWILSKFLSFLDSLENLFLQKYQEIFHWNEDHWAGGNHIKLFWKCHDNQHNDSQHSGTQHNNKNNSNLSINKLMLSAVMLLLFWVSLCYVILLFHFAKWRNQAQYVECHFDAGRGQNDQYQKYLAYWA
jgi:hypothetical protein